MIGTMVLQVQSAVGYGPPRYTCQMYWILDCTLCGVYIGRMISQVYRLCILDNIYIYNTIHEVRYTYLDHTFGVYTRVVD